MAQHKGKRLSEVALHDAFQHLRDYSTSKADRIKYVADVEQHIAWLEAKVKELQEQKLTAQFKWALAEATVKTLEDVCRQFLDSTTMLSYDFGKKYPEFDAGRQLHRNGMWESPVAWVKRKLQQALSPTEVKS